MSNRRKKWNRGVSLAEVVVAIMVITIVSAAAIVTTQRSLNYSTRCFAYQESRTVAMNALECFKFSTSAEEFKANTFRCGQLLQDYSPGNDAEAVFSFSASSCVTKVYINYSSRPNMDHPTFRAVCTENNNKVIFDISFEKTS